MLNIIYLVLSLFLTLTEGSATPVLSPPASDFQKHRIVKPILEHARIKRALSTTRDTSGAHHSEVTIKLPIDGEEYVLDLQLNYNLVTDNYVLQYQEKGKTVVRKPDREEIDLCHYGGTVRDKPGSWAALSTCHGVQGIVFDGHTMRYIEPAQGEELTSHHYIYEHSDLTLSYQCGNEEGLTNSTRYESHIKSYRNKRQASRTQIHGPYNENKQTRYVELVLVADYREYQASGYSVQKIYRQMKVLANMINSVFAPLNIYMALVGGVVWNEYDEIPIEQDGNQTLHNFLNYRQSVLAKNIPNDNAQLLTGIKFTDSVVGKGFVGEICSGQFSGGVASKQTEVTGVLAHTIAHEMGHNFGMNHDTDECDCPDQKCIMYPQSSSYMYTHWSSCSLNSLALSFSKGVDYCLKNKPKRLFDPSTCGNGFVEPGEQCDCGTMPVPRAYNPCHACCDPSTCMLRANATCGAGMCCDLQTCRPMSAGTVCRSAERECDLPEYCTGHSEFCPDDVYKMDTTPCGKDGQSAYCMRGGCHSHSDQCRLLWGTTGRSSHERCYSLNQNGDDVGDCGYDRSRKQYKSCSAEDAMCGRLQCTHLNALKLDFGMTFSSSTTSFITIGDAVLRCHAVSIDMGSSNADMGMVPDGAKCGDSKMCKDQRCVSVAAVRSTVESSVCSSNCSGHGVCNSEDHCHCDEGFAPPLCALPGPGGSLDSGPATDPNIQRNFMIALYGIFLGIIPSTVAAFLLIYCYCPTFLRCGNMLHKSPTRKDSLKDTNVAGRNSLIYANIDYKKSHRLPNFILTLLKGNLRNDSIDIKHTADGIHDLKCDSHYAPKIVNLSNYNVSNKTILDSTLYTNNEYIQVQNETVNILGAPNGNLKNITKNIANFPNAELTSISNGNMTKENASINNTNKASCTVNVPYVKSINTPKDISFVNDNLRNIQMMPDKKINTKPDNVILSKVKLRKPSVIYDLPIETLPNTTSNTLRRVPENYENLQKSNRLQMSAEPSVNLPITLDKHVYLPKVPDTRHLSNKEEKASDNVNLFNVKLRKTAGNIIINK